MNLIETESGRNEEDGVNGAVSDDPLTYEEDDVVDTDERVMLSHSLVV